MITNELWQPEILFGSGLLFGTIVYGKSIMFKISLDDQVIVSSLTHEGLIKEKKNKSIQTWQKVQTM